MNDASKSTESLHTSNGSGNGGPTDGPPSSSGNESENDWETLEAKYGHADADGDNLAASVWGHRLRTGQHWMEYLLEFLNVFAGFDYALGQGITTSAPDATKSPEQSKYRKFQKAGFRRFVFYDEHEKTDHPHDDEARRRLLRHLQNVFHASSNGYSDDGSLQLIRTLFRSFSAVQAKRSWYAKSLFPAHENLLFWEATRKGASKRRSGSSSEDVSDLRPAELDDGIDYNQRNFFARGGEVYYLILSAGTRHDTALRSRIENGLHDLLTSRNQAIGHLAQIIENVWTDLHTDDISPIKSSLGWIPNPDDPFYRKIAEDVATFLDAEIDPLESLTLLAHLICFHLTLYIYTRAERLLKAMPEATGDTSSPTEVASPYLVDMLTATGDNTLRRVSATLFKAREARIEECARSYVHHKIQTWFASSDSDDLGEKVKDVNAKVQNHFRISRLRAANDYEEQVDKLSEMAADSMEMDELQERFSEALFTLLMSDFNKNFLPVHRKLSKSVRFVAPHKGPSARFVLGDDLLKALTLSTVSSEKTFSAFLDVLYDRYNIVVGARHARTSGLFEQQRINSEYYDKNREALLRRMKYAGLAREFSDATTMVQPVRQL